MTRIEIICIVGVNADCLQPRIYWEVEGGV